MKTEGAQKVGSAGGSRGESELLGRPGAPAPGPVGAMATA